VHPPPNAQQQKEELQKKEEARRDEQERRDLEQQLQAFDAYEFYGSLEQWANHPIPSPIKQTIHLSPLRQKVISLQPMPLSRKELVGLRRISSDSGRLLYLLRAINHRGMECPYVHQLHRLCLEKAIEKCNRLAFAGVEYTKSPGICARLAQFFNMGHLSSMKRDLQFFKSRLETILIMCRHEEFAQDLIHLRRAVTHRTDMLMNIDQAPQGVAPQREEAHKSPKAMVRMAPSSSGFGDQK